MGGTVALVVGAGRGSRFGGALPKQYCHLGGEPIMRRTLRAFVDHERVSAVCAVIHPDDEDLYNAAAQGLELLPFVAGGATRQQSVLNGLESIASLNPTNVLIQDAARPFADEGLISRVIEALDDHPGALPVMPVIDTLKKGEDGLVTGTVDRTHLWRAQTPQGFRFDAILAAHRRYRENTVTDDAALAELAGLSVALIEGSEENVKVTTQDDMERAERIVQSPVEFRTGSGFDVHRIVGGDGMTLCGVGIPGSLALEGHSDADVALHALTDAILGSIAEGDIGSHFPPSDPQWRGVDSAVFLKHAVDLVKHKGGSIVNVDVTIMCEKPKIGPHRDAMRSKIASLLSITESRVSIKATTTERLGFTGRGEGIASLATACVQMSLKA